MSEPLPDLIEEVILASNLEGNASMSSIFAAKDEDELALLLESLPFEQRIDVWNNIQAHKKLDVLIAMRGDPRETIIKATNEQDWDNLFLDINAEDLLELADSLPDQLVERAYAAMDNLQKRYFSEANTYTEEQTGHWASRDFLVLPINARVRDSNRLMRREVSDHIDTLFLVNRTGMFSVAVKLNKLFGLPEHIPLVDLAEESIDILTADDDCLKASLDVQRSGYSSLPVVDETGKLLGRLDITTASELVNESYERKMMATAGMDEDEDLFSSVTKSAKSRALWLGINLLTAFLASAFIGMFEATLQQVVALAVLMPVVASMGGIAGSQTLTLIIRGLALGQVSSANVKALLVKELKVGGLNGVIWAIVIGIVSYVWFADYLLGVVISVAILFNIVAAACAGVFVPVILEKLKIDPALSGAVILTTVTDIVGFVAFLGLGTLFLI
ncbi:MAG: magnesium transporter [Paraglaciecola sp.]|jgi:magnesium transporter